MRYNACTIPAPPYRQLLVGENLRAKGGELYHVRVICDRAYLPTNLSGEVAVRFPKTLENGLFAILQKFELEGGCAITKGLAGASYAQRVKHGDMSALEGAKNVVLCACP